MALVMVDDLSTFGYVPEMKKWVGERIDNSIRLLDSQLGLDWPHKINLNRFDIGDARRCVLAQLGGYSRMKDKLGVEGHAMQYCFAGAEYENAAWRSAITSLCEQRPQPAKRSRLPWRAKKRETAAV